MISVAMALLAAAPPPAQGAPAGPSVQQAFEAAAALDASGTPAARLAAWEALERRATANRRTAAIVRIRKADALVRLNRLDEAAAAARAGLAELPATDPSLAEDRALAWLILAHVAEQSLDYAGAVEAYKQAELASDIPSLKVTAWVGLYRTQPYIDADAAAATAARTAPLIEAMQLSRATKAVLARYDAERLLNRGDFRGARDRAREAVRLFGGLTTRTDLNDVSARSDVAVAALLSGDSSTAREYMALTGAGRLPNTPFDPAVQMVPPDCGGDGGLRPNDVAVVEFSISEDGRVYYSAPVYSAGGGAVALEFARAALGWSWTPEQMKSVPAFYRSRTRVEMRCSTEFEKPGILAYLVSAMGDWLRQHGAAIPEAPSGSDAQMLPRERAELSAAEGKYGSGALALVPVLWRIAGNSVSSREETNAAAGRALAILTANRAPPAVRLVVQLQEWGSRGADAKRGRLYRDAVLAALANPAFVEDVEVRTVLRIVLSDLPDVDKARALAALRDIRSDPAVDKQSPLWTAAMARLASYEQAAGNAAAAREAFDSSGLTAEQCALVDSAPKLIRATGTYPNEAIQWGFDGWSKVQYDVTAEGKTTNIRAVISYPPFIFSKASAEGISGAKYAKSYRPNGGLGCGGTSSRYRFLTPGL